MISSKVQALRELTKDFVKRRPMAGKRIDTVCLILWAWLMLWASGVAAQTHNNADEPTEILLGIPPWTEKSHLLQWSTPAIEFVEQQSNVKIKPTSSHDLHGYFSRAAQHEYDVLVAPLHLALFLIRHYQYSPVMILRNNARQLIVTPKGTNIESLDDLTSGSIWVPHALTGGSLVTKRLLKDRSMRLHIHHAHDHWEVLNHLMSGKAKVGTVINTVLAKLDEPSQQQLNVIYRHPIPWEAMVITPTSKQETVLAIFEPLSGKTPDIDRQVVRSFEAVTEKALAELFEKMAPYLLDMEDLLPVPSAKSE